MTISAEIAVVPSPIIKKSRIKVMRSKAQWQALLDEFDTSGLTRSAFCKRHRIATSSLYRWQKELAGQSSVDGFIDITEPVAKAAPTPAVPDSVGHWQVELELGCAVVLRVRVT